MVSIKEIFNTEMEAFYKYCVRLNESSDKNLNNLFLVAGAEVMASVIADRLGLPEEAKGIEIDGDNYWKPKFHKLYLKALKEEKKELIL